MACPSSRPTIKVSALPSVALELTDKVGVANPGSFDGQASRRLAAMMAFQPPRSGGPGRGSRPYCRTLAGAQRPCEAHGRRPEALLGGNGVELRKRPGRPAGEGRAALGAIRLRRCGLPRCLAAPTRLRLQQACPSCLRPRCRRRALLVRVSRSHAELPGHTRRYLPSCGRSSPRSRHRRSFS